MKAFYDRNHKVHPREEKVVELPPGALWGVFRTQIDYGSEETNLHKISQKFIDSCLKFVIQNNQFGDDEQVKDSGESELCQEILDDLLLYEIATPYVQEFIVEGVKNIKS